MNIRPLSAIRHTLTILESITTILKILVIILAVLQASIIFIEKRKTI